MSGGHRDLATHPGAGLLDHLTWPWVFRPSRLEEVKDVLRARCRPQGEELVIRIGEGPTAADRNETRAAVSAGSHRAPSAHICPTCNTCPAGSNWQVRARSDRTVATSAVHRGTDRAAPRADRRSRLPGAIHYSGAVYPRPLVAAVGAAQVKNGECGRRRGGQASARLIACEPSTCSAPQPDR
jgi:hypothetical protein